MQFERATIVLKEGNWFIELPFKLNVSRRNAINSPRWLASVKPYKFIPIRRDNAHIATYVMIGHKSSKFKLNIFRLDLSTDLIGCTFPSHTTLPPTWTSSIQLS